MLDYRTLPFLSSQNPYLESLRPERAAAPEGSQGNDIEFVAYGWSRAPFNEAGTSTWPLLGRCCSSTPSTRASRSGRPFARNGSTFRVYFTNDRGGIYAIGYPVLTTFGHLVNLAELHGARRRRCTSLLLVGATRLLGRHGGGAGERTRAAPRVPRELLSQAVSCVRRRRGRARRAARRSACARTSRVRRGPISKTPPRKRRPSRSVSSKTTRRCSSAGRRRWRPSTTR